MAYALKLGGKTVPLTGMVPPEVLIDGAKNTIVYEQEPGLRDHLFKLFATNHSPSSQAIDAAGAAVLPAEGADPEGPGIQESVSRF